MAERLTSKNTVSVYNNSNSEIYLGKGEEATKYIYKLAQLEDIMEKYGIDGVEELENIFKTHHTFDTEISWAPKRTKNYELMIQIILEDEKGRDYEVLLEKILSHTKKQLDIWKRACELACDILMPKSEIKTIQLNDDNQIINSKEAIDYFYQQAKQFAGR